MESRKTSRPRRKSISMTATTNYANAAGTATSVDSNKLQDLIHKALVSPGKDYTAYGASDPSEFAASLLAGLRDAAMMYPGIVNMAKKEAVPLTSIDPSNLAAKSWFSSVVHAVATYGPLLLQTLGKDY